MVWQIMSDSDSDCMFCEKLLMFTQRTPTFATKYPLPFTDEDTLIHINCCQNLDKGWYIAMIETYRLQRLTVTNFDKGLLTIDDFKHARCDGFYAKFDYSVNQLNEVNEWTDIRRTKNGIRYIEHYMLPRDTIDGGYLFDLANERMGG
jgi:hypothetical protein